MKAALVRRYGPPDVVELADLAPPQPRAGQVQVRVRAASLNPLDVKLRAGALRPFLRLSFPAVLGFDFAGEIAALGARVDGWAEGARVYGRIDAHTGGTHAEIAVVSAAVIDRIPERLSFAEAASLPLTAMTALQALDQAGLAAGERLLVNGAAGGVGVMAIQIGRARGATVVGVTSDSGAPLVSRLGADVLNYTTSALARAMTRVDVIVDTVAAHPSPDLARLLAEHGRYISTQFSPGLALRAALGRFRQQRFGYLVSRADGALMRQVSALVEAGQLDPVIDSTFPFDRIVDAHRRVEAGHLRGKVIVTIP